MTKDELAQVRDGILAYKRRLDEAEHQRDRLLASLSRLCRELQAPVMEYLSPAIRAAWSDGFDLCDRIVAELQLAANPTATV